MIFNGPTTTWHSARKLIWLSALLIVSIIGWATWATLEEVVIGEAKSFLAFQQTIQSLEGGLVQEIMVRQGQSVVKGQPLAKLEDTRFKAAFLELVTSRHLLAQQLRLKAELATVVLNNDAKEWFERGS